MKPGFATTVARPAAKPAPQPVPSSRGAAAGLPRFMATPLGAGAPLAAGVRAPLERSFGADLGGVRVHTAVSASTAADAVGARAFAFGSDIVLSSRSSPHDLGLMAHETAHVLQQRGGPVRVQRFGGDGAFEREATGASAAVLRGESYQIALSTGGPCPQFRFWSTLASTVTEGIGGLVDRAVGYIRERARSIPGYDLLAVAIGRDPLTQAPVNRSAPNIVRGLLGLVPGGAAMFENLQQAGVIPRAAAWVEAELSRLNLTWARVSGTISGFISSLGPRDLGNLDGVFVRAERMFGPLVGGIVTFARGAAEKLYEFIFEGALALAGSAGQLVLSVLRRAGTVVKQIIANPIAFLRNLLAAVFGGFRQFGANILTHLKTAIFDWLFGALAGAGIQLPKKFDLQGILSLVLQVLGLTWHNLRLKLVRVLGEPVVAGIEKTFEFIKLIATQGLGAAWRKILEFASGIADTVIEGIKSWVQTTIVGQAIIKLVSMANPVGAIIQSIIAIYNTVMFVIERAKQIMAFVSAVTDSIANIAAGRVSAAVNYVEQTLARILPLVISFLARFIGLGGISAKIKEIITKIRTPIDKAIDKIVEWVVKQAQGIGTAVAGGARRLVGAITQWWRRRQPLRTRSGARHEIAVEGELQTAKVVVRSEPSYLDDLVRSIPAAQRKSATTLKNKLVKLMSKGRTHARDTSGRGVDETVLNEISRDMDKKLRELGNILVETGVLEAGADSPMSLPTPSYSFQVQNGRATEATVRNLSANRPMGSTPFEDPPGWDYAKASGQVAGHGRFVRMHLINHRLGGLGRASNLAPGPTKSNRLHLDSVETPIKTLVGDLPLQVGKTAVVRQYKVTVNYRGSSAITWPAAGPTRVSANLSSFPESFLCEWTWEGAPASPGPTQGSRTVSVPIGAPMLPNQLP